MKLRNILKDYTPYESKGALDLEIKGIAYDSRKVEDGFMFVAISGFTVDGHDYIEKAIEKGAVAVAYTDRTKVDFDDQRVTYIEVKDARVFLAHASVVFFGHPSERFFLVGVTGTNGKTSTTQILNAMLEGSGHTTGLLGTIGNKVGDVYYDSNVTTPESLELNQLFGEMLASSVSHCTMEVSSHSLDLHRVDCLDFDIGIFTNLTRDHLDYHKDFESYFEAKSKLFDMVKNRLINIDDDYGKMLKAKYDDGSTFTYGISEKADFYPTNIEYKPEGIAYTFNGPAFSVDVKVPLYGKIYVYNTMAALAALSLMMWSKEQVENAIQHIKPVEGRFEIVDNEIGVNVVVDYAHTPDALDNVLKIAKEFTSGQLIAVFGCGGDRDDKKRPMMGKIAESIADKVVITSDNPRTEKMEAIIEDILKGMSCPEKAIVDPDRKQGIKKALLMAAEGDTIVIAGKGHETYQIIGTEVIDFDDREVVKEIILNTEKFVQ